MKKTITLSGIAKMRLVSQGICSNSFTTAKDMVKYMGAMQAQDFEMAKWAIGCRLPGSTGDMIEHSVNTGEILRIHVLRPTWHFVSPDDIYWMLALTAPRIKTSMKSRDNELGLTAEVCAKSNKIIEKALVSEKFLTRDVLIDILKREKINSNNPQVYYHLFLHAELDGLICSGVMQGKKQTYTLLAERVPGKIMLSKTEALAKLAGRYFTSHGPATLHDFTWWSGLSVQDAKEGLELAKGELISEKTREHMYWFSPSLKNSHLKENSLFVLPAFDEFIISYKDRSAAISAETGKKAISTNGIFRPVIVFNGKVTGLWKRTITRNTVTVSISLFEMIDEKKKSLIPKRIADYAGFLQQQAVIQWDTI